MSKLSTEIFHPEKIEQPQRAGWKMTQVTNYHQKEKKKRKKKKKKKVKQQREKSK